MKVTYALPKQKILDILAQDSFLAEGDSLSLYEFVEVNGGEHTEVEGDADDMGVLISELGLEPL